MQKKYFQLIALLAFALLFPVNMLAESIEKTYASPFMTLEINAVLPEVESTTVEAYQTTFASADDDAWIQYIFGSRDGLESRFIGRYASDEPRTQENEHIYSRGEMFSLYDTKEARLSIVYRKVPVFESWENENEQAENNPFSAEDAANMAVEWVEEFCEATGWDGLHYAQCTAMPAFYDDETKLNYPGYYVVEFEHVIDGISIARDEYYTGTISEVRFSSDKIQVWIDDIGIFKVCGNYRTFLKTGESAISITPEEAMKVLEENFEFVPFHNEDNSFRISQISLCYRLVKTHENYDFNAQTELEARPAWRFASGVVRPSCQNEYVMFIDAETGEVLP